MIGLDLGMPALAIRRAPPPASNWELPGAAIDLDEIQRQINGIRDKVNDIANQINNLPKGILGATDVATGVLPVIVDFGNEFSFGFSSGFNILFPEPAEKIPGKPTTPKK